MEDEFDESEQECGPCARGGGLLLLALGFALGYMGGDLLTGGAITRMLFGAAPAGAGPAVSDNDGTEVTGEAEESAGDGES
jgi:hypothetical protein